MKLLIVFAVILICALIVIWTQKENQPIKLSFKFDKNKNASDLNLTLDRARKQFNTLEVKKINKQIIIRDRISDNDLVYITLDPNKPKYLVKNTHNRFVARYPSPPTQQEMQNDFGSLLNKYQ